MQVEYSVVKEIKDIIDIVINKKRTLLLILNSTLRRKAAYKTEIRSSQPPSGLSSKKTCADSEIVEERPVMKQLGHKSIDHYFRRKLKKSKLAQETDKKAEHFLKCKLLYVTDSDLKEKVKSFYMSLIQDLDFL